MVHLLIDIVTTFTLFDRILIVSALFCEVFEDSDIAPAAHTTVVKNFEVCTGGVAAFAERGDDLEPGARHCNIELVITVV